MASGGHSSSRCAGLSPSWPLSLRSTGSWHAGSAIVAHRPGCSAACGIFPDQGSNPCPLHWQADSQPLCHQGSPGKLKFKRGLSIMAVHFFTDWYWTLSILSSLCCMSLWKGIGKFHFKKIRKRLISQTFLLSRLQFYLWQWHSHLYFRGWVIMSMNYWAQ